MDRWPCLVRAERGGGRVGVGLGHPLVDRYLDFVAARARPNTVLAMGYDLKVFFEVVARDPLDVTAQDVLDFVADQRGRDRKVVRIIDGEAGLALSTIRRRLSSVSGLYAYLVTVGELSQNPVPRGMMLRPDRTRAGRGAPLVRAPRRLPRVLESGEVDALVAALRTARDRAMIEAMVLGGMGRCEVLGLCLDDLRPGKRRVFVREGKGGHQRIVPVSDRFFASVGDYLNGERPRSSQTDRVFVVLKGPNRGQPLSAYGLDEIMRGARRRAGLAHASCHELRHTCLTRLREAGMSLEALQAQAGHRSINSTRIYLHLGDHWLADQYRKAAEAIDAQAFDAEAGVSR